jgi:hypothetical protein
MSEMSTDGSALNAGFEHGFVAIPTMVFVACIFITLNVLSIYSIGWIIAILFPRTRKYLRPSTAPEKYGDVAALITIMTIAANMLMAIVELTFILDMGMNSSKPWVACAWEVGEFAVGGVAGVLLMVFMGCVVVKIVMVLVFGQGRNKEKK